MEFSYLATGLKKCFDLEGRETGCRGSGQDAEFMAGAAAPTPRFEVRDETVLDGLTGLVWTRKANFFDFALSQNEAAALVREMNQAGFGGHDDWRVPNRREMRSPIDYSRRDPALPLDHPFEAASSVWFWTDTPWAGNADYAWRVQLSGGRMFFSRRDGDGLVWPVRGQSPLLLSPGPGLSANNRAWPKERFEILGDAVLDRASGLAWTRDANLFGPLSWSAGPEKARELNASSYAGLNNWRMPNINELESLCDATRREPALPEGHPFLNVGQVYLSSTSSGFEPDWIMALYMDKGAVGVGHKGSAEFPLWCAAPL